MKSNKGIITLVGFILTGLGFLSLILSLIGVQFSFLVWIDAFGGMIGFLIRLLMILTGIVIIYLAQTDFEKKKYNKEAAPEINPGRLSLFVKI